MDRLAVVLDGIVDLLGLLSAFAAQEVGDDGQDQQGPNQAHNNPPKIACIWSIDLDLAAVVSGVWVLRLDVGINHDGGVVLVLEAW